MGYVVRMPQLGMTMEEGVVVDWPVPEGDEFEEGDVIAVVESEKTTNDVEAREDGVIVERFVDLDEPVGPGDPVAYVGEPGEDVPDDVRAEVDEGASGGTAEPTEEAEPSEAPTGSAPSDGGGGAVQVAKVSPRARAYARDNDLPVDALAELDGSGPDGAVVEADVIEAEAAGALTAGGGSAGEAEPVETPVPSGAGEGRAIYEEREGSQIRKTIARRMTQSAREIPQVTLNRRVPMEATLDLRERLAEDRDVELSITDFLLAACAEALAEYPAFNAIYEDGAHKIAGNVNLGVAVDVEGGLVAPVIQGAGRMDITELNEARSRLVGRTLSGEYTGEDLANGTFTVSNLGHFDVDSFDPLVNPPQVAILGVGGIRPEYDAEAGEPVPHIGLSLTFDHRAVDGADGARFLDAIADALKHPLRLVDLGGTGFREVPGGAAGDRRANARSAGGMSATVGARRWEWAVDEPEERGGTDAAPTPVEQFLGSLSSCLTLMINNVADRRDVPIEHVDVSVDASPDEGHIERIEIDVAVSSPADASDVERVVETADRACYVSGVIGEDVEKTVSVSVESP